MEIKFFVHSKCAYTFALAGNSWNAEFICLLLWCRCVCHRVQQNIKKLQMTHAEEKPISLLGGDFKRSAEHSFDITTSDLCLCSRLTWECSNGRDAIVASAAPLLPHHVWTRLKQREVCRQFSKMLNRQASW